MGIDSRRALAILWERRHGIVSDRATETTPSLEATAATVEALARALELHDYRRGRFGETSAHTARVTQLALHLAEHVAPELALDPQLAYGFRLHDIGMIGVSNATLLKPGAPAIRAACAASRSRSPPASSRSSTPSTR
jgi:HD-GYP domain-containing protein (c-di-GMP phosphodiesterase class II)